MLKEMQLYVSQKIIQKQYQKVGKYSKIIKSERNFPQQILTIYIYI